MEVVGKRRGRLRTQRYRGSGKEELRNLNVSWFWSRD